MAAPILQFKKGTTTPGSIFYAAEPAYDTTAKILYLGDAGGSGSGTGTAVASASATSAATALLRETAAGTSAGVILLEETGSGTDAVTIQVPALAASYNFTLPNSGGTNGFVLQTDGSGGTSWVAQTSGYTGWTIQGDAGDSENITTGLTVDFVGGTGIDTSYSSTNNELTIAIDSTVVTTTDTQTLTNKTLTSPVLTTPQINDSAADHQYIFASGDLAADRTVTLPVLTGNDTFVFEAHTQTLSNKTLDGAISTAGGITYNGSSSGTTVLAASATASGTLTLPAATDTLVGKATTDIFTNKTFDANGTGNSLSNVEVDNFAAAAIVLESEGIGSNDNDTTLPTSAAVKDYVDTQVGNVDVETGLSDGTTTSTVNTSQTLTIQGTAAEVEVGLSNQTFTVGLPDNVTVAGTLAVNGATLSTDDTTFNLLDTTATTINFGGAGTTIDIGSASGTTTVKNNLVVDGNLTVSGSTTTVNTNNLLVEDRVIELGLVDGAAPSSNTTWDTAIAFNYHTDTTAKKSALVWLDNTALVAAATITETSGSGNADPSIAIDSFANFAVDALYIGDPNTASNEVIDSSKNVINVIIDGGSY